MQTQHSYTGTQTATKILPAPPSSLLQLLQSIFDDVTLYNEPSIREMVTRSDKGFLTIEQIMGLPMFRRFVEGNPDLYCSAEEIGRVVREDSRKLVLANFRVKRIEPFVDRIGNKQLKPIFVQRLPNKPTSEIVQFFKSIVGIVYQIYHKRQQKWAIIITSNYEALAQLKDELYFNNDKITVLSPLQTLIAYGENQRLNSDFNIVKLYDNKSLYQYELADLASEEEEWGDMGRGGRGRHEEMMGHSYRVDNRMDKEFFQQFEHEDMDMEDMEMNYQQPQHRKQPKNYKYSKHFLDEQLRHRAHALQQKRNHKRQLDNLMNYNNQALLLLRGIDSHEMCQ